MGIEIKAPSPEPDANEQSSPDILPSLPELSKKEEIALALRQLAESEPDEIDEELRLKEISDAYNIGIKAVRAAFSKVKADFQQEKEIESISKPTEEELAAKEQAEKTREAEQKQIECIIKSLQAKANLLPIFHKLLERSGYLCDEILAGSVWLSHGARLLPDSSAYFFNGSSASGKSAALIKGSAFLPEEIVLNITSMSNLALQYIGDIRNKYVMFGEIAPPVDGQDDPRQTALRQLLSENKITHWTVEKQSNNKLACVKRETEGPCVAVATTTKDPKNFHDELQNRAAWIAANDSKEITKSVLSVVAQRAANPLKPQDIFLSLVMKAFKEFHRTLRSFSVLIPFADRIKPANDHVTARRLFPMLLNLIRSSALLHQHSREQKCINDHAIVVATIDDYRLAYKVLTPSAPRILESYSDRARKAFDEMLKPSLSDGKMLSTSQIQQLIKAPDSTVRRWLKDFVEAGLLVCPDYKYGKQNVYLLGQAEHFTQELGLISPEHVQSKPLNWSDLL